MEHRQALAGFALSGALFVLALPSTSPDATPCRNPGELEALDGHTVTVRCDAPQSQAGEIRGPARRLFGLPIELNCTDARTLETLDGIGSVRAQRIVEERARRPFERVDDLRRVNGIGPKTLAALRPLLAAGPPPSASRASGSTACRSSAVREFRAREGGRM